MAALEEMNRRLGERTLATVMPRVVRRSGGGEAHARVSGDDARRAAEQVASAITASLGMAQHKAAVRR